MSTLPGTLSTPTAGPILCPGAPVSCQWDSADATNIVRGFVIEDLGPERVIWCSPSRYIGRDNRARVFLSLDLAADLGPTVALRWLGRHYGVDVGIGCPGWSRFGGASPVWCLHTAKIDLWFASGGRSAVDRCATNIFDVPGISAIVDPIHAIAAACAHAAGHTFEVQS